MVLLGYSGARGTLIYEKNLMSKISCQTPFNIAHMKGWLSSDKKNYLDRYYIVHWIPSSFPSNKMATYFTYFLLLYTSSILVFQS
jgi:hypothetical protein